MTWIHVICNSACECVDVIAHYEQIFLTVEKRHTIVQDVGLHTSSAQHLPEHIYHTKVQNNHTMHGIH